MNISLIGMPASGKTTTAKALKNMVKDFLLIDTDEKIVQNENRSVNDIFNKNGEEYFRKLETNILEEILKHDNQIISTGGGIVKSDRNIELLKEKSLVIYLRSDLETLVDRAKKNKDRPLLNDCDITEKIKKLLNEREKQYEKAHFIIETKDKTAQEIAKEITEKIK